MSELLDEFLRDGRERMVRAVEAALNGFASVRAGRANPSMLDRVMVDYYGNATPLKQLATISAPEARLLTIQPYDSSSIKVIEKGINESGLGLNPSNDGKLVRLVLPEMTEERRRELVKQVRAVAEDGRISVRNVRREVMGDLKEARSEGEVGEDEERRAEAELQKATDAAIADLDGHLKAKETDILEV